MNSDPQLELAERLAALLASDDGTLLLARLQRAAFRAQPSGRGTPEAETPRLGAWEPVAGADGAVEFERAGLGASERRFWADVERIPAKRGRRVVLLGESVARGYLYDPALTPARVLEDSLPGVEVVDLARTDMSAGDLLGLFGGLPALHPDAVVVFAGNNWTNILFTLDDLARLADALRTRGYAGLRDVYLGELLVPRCEAVLDRLAAVAREHELPVVLIVPEFNLGDWRADLDALAPVLAGDANARWLEAREQGDGARLLELDGGTSPLGHELLAEEALAAGDFAEARVRREAARDAVCGLLVAHSPRCPRVVQDVLRAKAVEHGLAVVDLPRLFAERLGGALPDRRLFLDYCHLTADGIAVAMAATAEALAPLVGVTPQSARPPLEADDEATAHLLAAVHCAHHGGGDDLVRHHCRRAASGGPEAHERLRLLVEVATADGEQWLTRAYAELCHSPLASRYLAPGDPLVAERLAEVELAEAASAAVGEEPAWRDGGRRVDLLSDRHSAATFWQRQGRARGPARAYHRAYDTRSRFFMVGSGGAARLELTVRLPGGSGEAEVALNGAVRERLSLDGSWRTEVLELPAGALRRGLNELEISWPFAAAPKGELERAAHRLERGIFPDVYPAYGEIHTFAATS